MSECYPIVNIWCKYQPFEPTIMRLFEFDGWGNIPFTTFLFCFLFSVHYITFFPLSNLSFFLLIFFSVPTSVSVIYIYIFFFYSPHVPFSVALFSFVLFFVFTSHLFIIFFILLFHFFFILFLVVLLFFSALVYYSD